MTHQQMTLRETETVRQAVLRMTDTFLQANPWYSKTAISKAVFNTPGFFTRLKDGHDFTTEKVDRLRAWFAANDGIHPEHMEREVPESNHKPATRR